MQLKNNKVLVTGADGFIGSHLVETLIDYEANVKAFCFYNSFGSYGWLDTFSKAKLSKIEIFMGDIRDPNGVRAAVKGADVIFHLAALIGIPYSYHSPDSYVDTNIKGTLNIIQAARDFNVKKVLVTSTSEVYGTALYTPIDEKHPRQSQSPYSATKIGADCIADSFYRAFNMPITIIRPFNTYGPRQSARAIIPTIIIQILSGIREIKLGNLTPMRDLNYVLDTCNGFVEIAKSDKTIGEEINIASGCDVSIGELVDRIISLIKPKQSVKIVTDDNRIRPEKSEVMRLLGSNKKIKELTKWLPSYGLDSGLKETIDWIKQNLYRYKENIYNV
jgi:NAD dependent epimerase/dehydratase